VFVRKLAKDAYSFTVNAAQVAHGKFLIKDKDGYESKDTLEKIRTNYSSLGFK
jgi:hypothetical protein